MIDKEYGQYFVVCDVCGEGGGRCDTFQEAVDSKKEQGWKSVKRDGNWRDLCPECWRQPE